MNFGEVDFVLTEQSGGKLQGVPFVLAGEGRLPARYEAQDDRFQRLSLGTKARYPFPVVAERVVFFLEGGGMVSYYDSDAIGTPFELEVVAGVGAEFNLGKGWAIDAAARARHPTGNGNNHKEPEHAPHGTAAEFVFGLRKDF